MLVRELAHERRDVGGGVVARRRGGRCGWLGGLLGRGARGVGRLAGGLRGRLLRRLLRGSLARASPAGSGAFWGSGSGAFSGSARLLRARRPRRERCHR